ncbi:MAG: mannose-6-phosphate isomerase, class I [Desulfobacterales bacterium]
MNKPFRPVLLDNPAQTYAWGSKTAIQKLLGLEPDGHTPWAELWMGAHPKAPSRVKINGHKTALDQWIRQHPEDLLGKYAAESFDNTLPYLFKVLAADQPLSIQAHPDRDRARKGFARENSQGIPVDAPHRNYRDPRPKPELICAIEPFGAMIGFRSVNEIRDLITRFCPENLEPEIRMIEDRPDEKGIKNFFYALMTMDQLRRTKIIDEAIEHTKEIKAPEAGWIKHLYGFYPDDIGVLAPAFLNIVTIEPGHAAFLAPGVIHAYLYGVGMEIMANSDNVLRGGLTRKHIDPEELMRVLDFSPRPLHTIAPQPTDKFEASYPAEAEEFALSRIRVGRTGQWQGPAIHSAEILFCIRGKAVIENASDGFSLPVKRGDSVLVPAAAGKYKIAGDAVLYRARVPV